MKTKIALLATIFMLAVSVQAHSESVFVAKVPSVWRTPNGEALLEFRSDLRRAWISATLCEKYVPGNWAASECKQHNRYNFRVPGLIYDSFSGEIRLGGHVCARVDNGLVGPIYRQTGNCGLNIGAVRDEYDDGAERHWRWMDVISVQLK
jgi:hypothetical protein